MTYPTIRPAITLDFQKSRKLDPRITVSRSSSATYVDPASGLIKTAPDGVARFEKEGLLIEEARTNSFHYSTELDNAYWDLATGLTKTANNAVSPDGNTTALLVTEDTSTGEHVFGKTANVSVNDNCMGIFVKPNGKTRVGFRQGVEATANVVFDLTGAGSVVSGIGFIEQHANGWYRITQVRSGTGNKTFFHLLNDADDALSYTGDGTSGCWIWGYQKEAGTFPTSLIYTAGAAATRAADVVSISNAEMLKVVNPGGNACFVTTHWSTWGANQEYIFYDRTGYLEARQWRTNQMRGNGIASNNTEYTPIPGQETYNTVFESRDGDTVSMGNNAGSFTSGTWAQTLPGTQSFQFGFATNFQRKQVIARMLYYPQPLTQAELEATSEAMT